MTTPRARPAWGGLVLAGGQGRRLGGEKAGLLLGGRSFLARVTEALAAAGAAEVLVAHRAGQSLPPVDLPLHAVADRRAAGPLAGLEAGLEAARHEVVVVVAVDFPLLRPALPAALVDWVDAYDLALPVLSVTPQPLLAAYRRPVVLRAVRHLLDAGDQRAVALAEAPGLRVRRLDAALLRSVDPDLRSLHNVNEPDDLRAAEQMLRHGD